MRTMLRVKADGSASRAHGLYESGAVETPPSMSPGTRRLEDGDQVEGVPDSLLIAPVRRVNVRLDGGAME